MTTPQPRRPATSRRRFLGRAGWTIAGAVAGQAVVAGTAYAETPPVYADGPGAGGPDAPVASLQVADVLWRIDTQAKLIALTFDDGPGPDYTPVALDLLAAAKVPATFFVIGRHVEQHPDLLLEAVRAGHEIGNHTWDHLDLATLDHSRALDELQRCAAAVKKVAGIDLAHLRPPYGHIGGAALMAAGEMGYDITLWSEKLYDGNEDAAANAKQTIASTVPGSILLAHDVGPNRLVGLHALPEIISTLQADDWTFVTVSDLLARASPAPGRQT